MSPRLVNEYTAGVQRARTDYHRDPFAYSRMIAVAAVGLAYRRHEITLDEQQAELAEIRRWKP